MARLYDTGIIEARRLARAQDPEPPHVFQVAKTACQLFDQLNPLHVLSATERRILEAAALLHDIGRAQGGSSHHKRSRDMILDAHLDGFTLSERTMIACIARYHRKAEPKPTHKVFRELSGGEQAIVEKLAAILRIADGLDRSHRAAVRRLEVCHVGAVVRITVEQRHPNQLDLWGAEAKSAMFERVFGVNLVFLTT